MQTRDRISLQEPDRSWVLWGQTQAGVATVGPSSAVPFKIKDGLTVQPSGGSPGHTFQRSKELFSQRNRPTAVYSGVIPSSPPLEAAQVPFGGSWLRNWHVVAAATTRHQPLRRLTPG